MSFMPWAGIFHYSQNREKPGMNCAGIIAHTRISLLILNFFLQSGENGRCYSPSSQDSYARSIYSFFYNSYVRKWKVQRFDYIYIRARICKPFKEPSLAESIPGVLKRLRMRAQFCGSGLDTNSIAPVPIGKPKCFKKRKEFTQFRNLTS